MSMDPSQLNGNSEDLDSIDRQSDTLQDDRSSVPFERDVDYDSDSPPTSEEWNNMKRYGSFITHDDANQEHVFHVHDIVTIMPNGKDPDEPIDPADLWIAQIKSIRAYDSHSVWIRAKWFYHPRELPRNVKGGTGKLKQFGKFERISSNLADFIPTSTCCGHARISYYNEQDLDQEEIDSESFYYRCEYECQKNVLSRPSVPCTICKKPYNPDIDIMHFCPRPKCCRAWHAPCLEKSSWFIRSPDNFLQRMESMEHPPDRPSPGPKKKRLKKNEEVAAVAPCPAKSYALIPPALLHIARQPIARGGALGVAGNIRSVTRARTMLKNALEGIDDIPDDWVERVGHMADIKEIGPSAETKRDKEVLSYECPSCGEPI